MYEIAMTLKSKEEGLYEKHTIDEYKCIKISDDIFENLLTYLTNIEVYFPYREEWGKNIELAGVTVVPFESLKIILNSVITYLKKDYFNLYELKELEIMLRQALEESKNIIIFGI